jgi:hypothetical protein
MSKSELRHLSKQFKWTYGYSNLNIFIAKKKLNILSLKYRFLNIFFINSIKIFLKLQSSLHCFGAPKKKKLYRFI